MANENEYVVPIGLDGDKFLSEIDKAVSGIDRLEKVAQEATNTMSGGMRSAATATEQSTNKVQGFFSKTKFHIKEFVGGMRDGFRDAGASINKGLDEKPVNRFTAALRTAKSYAGAFLGGMKDGFREVRAEAEKTTEAVGDKGGGLGSMLKKGAGLFAGYFAVSSIIQTGKEIFNLTAEFQKFEEVLTISLGSRSEAQKAMRQIQDFAATTPFQVGELTDAYVKFANRGFVPLKEELTAIGDLASSQGKSFDQLTEAILDAQSGEFERMKEFGIKGKKAGDTVTLAFGDFRKTVKNTETDIRNAILEIGKLPQVAGGMAAVSKTLGGQFSNLQDNFDSLLRYIGGQGEGLFAGALGSLNDFISFITETLQSGKVQQFFAPFFDGFMSLYNSVKGVISGIIEFGESSGFMDKVKDVLSDIVRISGNVLTGIGNIITAVYEWAQQDGLIQNFIGGSLKFVYGLIGDIIHAIAEIPDYWQAVKAAVGQVMDNLKGRFQTFINDLMLIKLAVQKAFTFDDEKEAKLQAEIARRTEENEKIKQRAKSGTDAFEDKLAEQRKKRADKEAEDERKRQDKLNKAKQGQDNSPVKGRGTKAAPASSSAAKKTGKSEAEIQKEENEKLIRLATQLRDAEISAMQDVEAAKVAKIQLSLEGSLRELEAEKTRLQKKKKLSATELAEIDTINKLKVQLEKNAEAEIKKVHEDAAKTRLALQAQARKEILELQEESTEKELAQIDLETQEQIKAVKEKYKDEEELRIKLEEAIAAAAARKRKKIQDDAAIKQIEDEQAVQELLIETAAQYVGGGAQVEEMKQLEILKVRKKYAEKQLEALIASGKAENDIAVLQLRKLIQDLNKEIKTGEQNAKGDLFSILGIDRESFDKFAERMSMAADLISEFASVLADAAQEELAIHDEKIAKYEDEISELENKVDEETELKEAGMANDLTNAENELAAKRKLKEQEVKDREKTQAKLDKLQKLQMIADTAGQVSNLITSASQIFKAFSAIPFVGIPLAIAAIGLMFGTFATAKVKAFQSIGKRERGGWVDGKSHAQGGETFYSADRSVELEGDEFVTNKRAAKKYAPVLEAMNEGRLNRLNHNEAAFREMLSEMGIHINEDVKGAVNDHKAVMAHNISVSGGSSSLSDKHLSSIDNNITYLANKERNKTEVLYEDSEIRVERQGNVTRKIKKHGR
jgi:hypothetical protein